MQNIHDHDWYPDKRHRTIQPFIRVHEFKKYVKSSATK